jgi:hypothetical protein
MRWGADGFANFSQLGRDGFKEHRSIVNSFTKRAKEGYLNEKSSAQRAILTNGLSGEKLGSGEAVYLLVTDSAESVAELGSKTLRQVFVIGCGRAKSPFEWRQEGIKRSLPK